MTSTRITSFVICLGLACLMLTGSVLAGTTKVTAEVPYAREVGKANRIYTLPANTVTRTMSVLRASGENFFVDISLSGNALWDASGPPVDTSLVFGTTAPATYTVALVGTSADKAKAVFSVTIAGTAPLAFPVGTFTTTGLKVKDVDNVLGGGGTITITIETRDLGSGNPIDVGVETDDWLTSKFGVTVKSALSSTTAVIDVATARKKFVDTSTDDLKIDKGATLGILGSSTTALSATGTAYTLVAADKVELIIAGNLSGVTTIIWDAGGGNTITHSVTATELTNQSAKITIAGGNASLNGDANNIHITIDGTTVLSERTLTITVNLVFPSGGSAGGEAANNRTLVATSTLTKWTLNGTVLIANFMNGNTNLFTSRIYLFNSSSSAGNITARVWTMPTAGNPEVAIGTVALGSLGPGAGRNVKLAEDILTPLITAGATIGDGTALALPYIEGGGNLVVEITVEATLVTGNGQVFVSDGLASFGIFPLQKP